MSKENIFTFFEACAQDDTLLTKMEHFSLPELLFHVRNHGYYIVQQDLVDLIGAMEAHIIMEREGEQIDAFSSLWPRMYGQTRLRYVVTELYQTLSAEERQTLLGA